jgi:hypothetical protein
MDSFYIYVYFMSYQEAQKLFDLYTIEEKRNFLELFLSIFFSKRKLQDSLDYQLLSEGRTPQYLGIHFSVLVPYKRKGRT